MFLRNMRLEISMNEFWNSSVIWLEVQKASNFSNSASASFCRSFGTLAANTRISSCVSEGSLENALSR